MKTTLNSPKETHPDPITGEPGAHLVGTSLGAVVGGAATTAVGVVAGGPLGGLLGAAVGGFLGGFAGKEVAEAIDLTLEHEAKESTPIQQDPAAATTELLTAPQPDNADHLEQRAAEITRRGGRKRVTDSDRRRAFQELVDEGPPMSKGG